MKRELKNKLMVMYFIVLVFCFWAGGEIFVYTHSASYNITCENGSVVQFNESTVFVCGQANPLSYEAAEINYTVTVYLSLDNLT